LVRALDIAMQVRVLLSVQKDVR